MHAGGSKNDSKLPSVRTPQRPLEPPTKTPSKSPPRSTAKASSTSPPTTATHASAGSPPPQRVAEPGGHAPRRRSATCARLVLNPQPECLGGYRAMNEREVLKVLIEF